MTKRSEAFGLIDPAKTPQSRRREPRVPANIWVTIEHDGAYFDAIAANVGLGGAFVESAAGLVYGAQVVVHLPLPSLPEALLLPAIVRWTSASGFGVQFLEVGALATHAISALVAAAY